MKPIIPKREDGKGLVPFEAERKSLLPKGKNGRGLVPFEGER